MSEVIRKLQQLHESDEYPLHMPGHKRRGDGGIFMDAFGVDITEIIGYDNLYEADGMLKDAMERAAKVYGAEETFFLVNGSTVGILSAITGVAKRGERILVARNCHKAVFHAIELRELQAVYLYPEFLPEWDIAGGIAPQEVEDKLAKYPDIRAIVITSPTYEGIVSDVEAIAEVAHAHNIPLVVDEAHGAHLPFDTRFPKSALACGADVVIQSMHKTLPSFTQTALIHLKKGYADTARIKEYIGYYQTSSPSYLFMAGMDACIAQIEEEGAHLWDAFFAMRDSFVQKMVTLENIRILQGNDPCKLVISVKGTVMTGAMLQKILLGKYHIQLEMAAETYVLGIVTMCDTQEGFDRLAEALLAIDKELAEEPLEIDKGLVGTIGSDMNTGNTDKRICMENVSSDGDFIGYPAHYLQEDIVYTLAEVREKDREEVSLEDSEGRICASYVNLYPPGVPLFLPGERICKEHITLINRYLEKDMHVQGVTERRIHVCK